MHCEVLGRIVFLVCTADTEIEQSFPSTEVQLLLSRDTLYSLKHELAFDCIA